MATYGFLLRRRCRYIWLRLRTCLSAFHTRQRTSRPLISQKAKKTVTGANDTGQLAVLEGHYRPCACRSRTPFFSERQKNRRAITSHLEDPEGQIYRAVFQHDRDKVLYCRSFRRLRLKTQVFPEQSGDYLRTRLDHTLEVAQIARHFARQLGLNEDVADAIAHSHDIGHTPFGHSGERALHKFLKSCEDVEELDGFKHNWQGLRVVDLLEKSYPEYDGLDLTNAVRIGILKHTGLAYSEHTGPCGESWPLTRCRCNMENEVGFDPESRRCDFFESQITGLADEIAQVIHDLEDAVVSDAFRLEQLVRTRDDHPLLKRCLNKIKERIKKKLEELDAQSSAAELANACDDSLRAWADWKKFDFADQDQSSKLMFRLRSEMIYRLTADIIHEVRPKLTEWERDQIGTGTREEQVEQFNTFVDNEGEFPDLSKWWDTPIREEFYKLKGHLHQEVVRSERVSRMDGKADYVIRRILEVYLSRPKEVHQSVLDQYRRSKRLQDDIRGWSDSKLKELRTDPVFVRAAVDYVAGMTDRFALQEYDQLYSAYPRTA